MSDPVEPQVQGPPAQDAPEGNPDELLIDAWSRIAITPITIRGIFIMMTRIHWSDSANYGPAKAKMGDFVWHKDPKQRTLHVDYDYNYDPTKLDKKPAIFVGTSDFNFLKIAVDNQRTQTEDRAGESYAKIADTNIILRHIGKTPDESLQMADLSAQFFLGMRKLVQERLKVHGFEVMQILSSKPFEKAAAQADPQFIVDLVMNLKYNAVWMIVREGHRLKTVTYKQSLDDYSTSA